MSENPLDTLSEDEQQALVDLARASESNKLSRRDAMKALGMLGLGGLVGAGGARVVEESVDPATAQASGTVGTSGSPVDVFAESVDTDTATINTTLTDAAGVPHTGELADDGDAQPPESHDNTAHSETFVSDGDGTTRQIWVISNGASDPAGADPEDIIFEEES